MFHWVWITPKHQLDLHSDRSQWRFWSKQISATMMSKKMFSEYTFLPCWELECLFHRQGSHFQDQIWPPHGCLQSGSRSSSVQSIVWAPAAATPAVVLPYSISLDIRTLLTHAFWLCTIVHIANLYRVPSGQFSSAKLINLMTRYTLNVVWKAQKRSMRECKAKNTFYESIMIWKY